MLKVFENQQWKICKLATFFILLQKPQGELTIRFTVNHFPVKELYQIWVMQNLMLNPTCAAEGIIDTKQNKKGNILKAATFSGASLNNWVLAWTPTSI